MPKFAANLSLMFPELEPGANAIDGEAEVLVLGRVHLQEAGGVEAEIAVALVRVEPARLGLDAQELARVDANESLLDALQGGGGPGLDGKTKILLRAATAAVLNADNGNPPYPLSVSQIISQTNAALASCNGTNITNLATQLDTYNNRCDTR